jgi:hypothetical protein
MNPATEVCMRLYVVDWLSTKDKDFRKFFYEVRIDNFTKHRKDKSKIIPLEIDTNSGTSAFHNAL